MLHTALTTVTTLMAGPVPDPGSGTAPPGSGKFLTLLQWALWIGFGVCVAGLIKAGASMALAGSGRSAGGAHEHGMGIALAVAGAAVCSSAALIVGGIA